MPDLWFRNCKDESRNWQADRFARREFDQALSDLVEPSAGVTDGRSAHRTGRANCTEK